jgi:hypothetical protein
LFHEDTTYSRRAGKRDFFNLGVRADFLADFGDGGEGCDYLDNAGWNASFEGEDGLSEG